MATLVNSLTRPSCTLHQRPCESPLVATKRSLCRQQIIYRRPSLRQCASPNDAKHSQDDEEFEGLTPEEDWTVPGGYQDSLSSNTELGRALQEACDELDNLSTLEKDSLSQASELLQKLGYKGNIMEITASKEDS